MNCKDIIKEYLKKHGFEGLHSKECICGLEDLMPISYCSELLTDCEPGYKVPCDPIMCACDGDCDFHISTEKPKEKERSCENCDNQRAASWENRCLGCCDGEKRNNWEPKKENKCIE